MADAQQIPPPPPGFQIIGSPSGAATATAPATGSIPPPPPGFSIVGQPTSTPATPSPSTPPAKEEDKGFFTGLGQSFKGTLDTAKAALPAVLPGPLAAKVETPPSDAREQVVHSIGGPAALVAYRAAKSVYQSAENLVNAQTESYSQAAQDFQKAIYEFHNKDYRGMASSLGSTGADLISGSSPAGPIVGSRIRELTEGARPEGDLATPVGRDVGDALQLYLGDKLPAAVVKTGQVGRDFVVGRLTPEEIKATPATARFQPATNLTPEEVLDHAKQEGIELTPGQATKTKPRQAAQGLGERAFVGGQNLEEKINQNKLKLTDSVSKLADTYDPRHLGVSEESTGDVLKTSAQRAKDHIHANAQAAYQNLPDQLKTSRVDTSEIKTKWEQVAKDEKAAITNLPPEIGKKLQSVITRATKLGGDKSELTFNDAQKVRSAFREMGETTAEDLPHRYKGMFRVLTGDLDKAMTDAATKQGYLQEWRNANEGWKAYHDVYGDRQSPVYRILNQADPAKITRDVLNRGSAEDIDILRKADVNLSPLKRQVIADIANAGYRVGREGLGGYSDSFLNTLLGPTAKRELYLKAELGRRMGFEVNPSGTSNVLAAEMQIPTSKEGLIRGVGGSAGFAKVSEPRPVEAYLPRTNPITAPKLGGAVGLERLIDQYHESKNGDEKRELERQIFPAVVDFRKQANTGQVDEQEKTRLQKKINDYGNTVRANNSYQSEPEFTPKPADIAEFKTWKPTGPTKVDGLVKPGNIDLTKRPLVHHSDGSVSTLYSGSFSTPRGEVLVPFVSPAGKMLTREEAVEHYRKTGENLGTFKTPEDADRYAEMLHNRQGAFQTYKNGGKYKPSVETWDDWKEPEK